MGKDLRGKELGRGISQREDGLYVGRYTNKYGKRVQKVLLKLQELRQWQKNRTFKVIPMEWRTQCFYVKKVRR